MIEWGAEMPEPGGLKDNRVLLHLSAHVLGEPWICRGRMHWDDYWKQWSIVALNGTSFDPRADIIGWARFPDDDDPDWKTGDPPEEGTLVIAYTSNGWMHTPKGKVNPPVFGEVLDRGYLWRSPYIDTGVHEHEWATVIKWMEVTT